MQTALKRHSVKQKRFWRFEQTTTTTLVPIFERRTTMNEVRTLAEMPMDKEFNGELCHATGYEWFDGKEWWNEYEDADGNLHYGR